MVSRSLFSFLILAIVGLCALSGSSVLAGPPPPPANDVMQVTIPQAGAVYHVGDKGRVKVSVVGGKDAPIYKAHARVQIYLQKDIRYPKLNRKLGEISVVALTLGDFDFVFQKGDIIKEQANVPYRVRLSFSYPGVPGEYPGRSGYVDSAPFKLLK